MPNPIPYRTKAGRTTYRVRYRYNRQQLQESFDTLREAHEFCSDIESRDAAYALQVLADKAKAVQSITLDELAAAAFAWKGELHPRTGKPLRVKSDRTVADYRRDYKNWISPALGDRAAEGIHEADVQELVDAMSAAGLSGKSVADRHAILFGIYKYGTSPSRRLVPSNPCVGTELPKRVKKPPKGLRPAEWQALYPALRQINPDAADLALFLLASGWRISEASALTLFEVEDTGDTMHVTMGRVLRRNAAGVHVFVDDEGKSDASMRRIQLDDEVAEMVRRRMAKVADMNGLLFTTPQGSKWHSANFARRYWHPAVKAANLTRRPTPHWLRHTSVFWLILGRKATLPEIQRRIGHEHYSTTVDVYGRMVDDVSTDALEAFQAMRNGTTLPTESVRVIEAAQERALVILAGEGEDE